MLTHLGVEKGAIFMLFFFVMLFFRIKSLTPNHFLAKQTDFGRIFSSFIDDIYNANISEEHAKDKPVYK